MKIRTWGKPFVYLLLALAKFLYFLESRAFVYLIQILLVVGLAYVVSINRSGVEKFAGKAKSQMETLVWYKKLPPDYLKKQQEESDVIYKKYLEAIKPLPPKKTAENPFPYVSAKAYLVLDVPSNEVLSSKDASVPMPPASTAKLATALAALRMYKLTEEISVPQFCTQIEATKAEFLQGQRFLVSDLLKSLLVYSSADSGCVLSVGKSSYSQFVSLMNKVSAEAGLTNTKFTNPVGLDDTEGGNLSTATDLAKLGEVAMKNEFIKNAVQLKEFELKDLDGKYSKKLANTNKLLTEVPGTVGIKTGTTGGAGEVLIYEYSLDKKNLIIVVMGSQDRFSDTRNILTWVLSSFTWN